MTFRADDSFKTLDRLKSRRSKHVQIPPRSKPTALIYPIPHSVASEWPLPYAEASCLTRTRLLRPRPRSRVEHWTRCFTPGQSTTRSLHKQKTSTCTANTTTSFRHCPTRGHLLPSHARPTKTTLQNDEPSKTPPADLLAGSPCPLTRGPNRKIYLRHRVGRAR